MAIEPPYNSTRSATIARPRPDPGAAWSARTPRCRTSPRSAAGTPGPSSSTTMCTCVGAGLRRHADRRPAPLAGVVEQVAQHLVEVFALHAHDVGVVHGGPDRQTALGVQLAERAHQRRRRRRHAGRGAGRGARGRRPGVGEVVVDLPAHPIHLLPEHVGARRVRRAALGLAGDDRQRRLQAVGKIAGPRQGPPHRLGPMTQQRVEVVDERLHLLGERPVDTRVVAGVHPRQPRAQPRQGGERPPHLPDAAGQAQHGDGGRRSAR